MSGVSTYPSPPVSEPRAEATPGIGVLDIEGQDGIQLPTFTVPGSATAPCWWLGVHGGSGESSLARLFPAIKAAQHHWPVVAEGRTRVVLCARTNYWGMVAAQAAYLDHYRRLHDRVELLGLVLVADSDAGPRPALSELLLDLNVAANGHVWRLPWVESWALGRLPSPADSRMKEVEAIRLGATAALRAHAAQP
jgi:hypothetical protein